MLFQTKWCDVNLVLEKVHKQTKSDGSNKSQYGKEFANIFGVLKCFYLLFLCNFSFSPPKQNNRNLNRRPNWRVLAVTLGNHTCNFRKQGSDYQSTVSTIRTKRCCTLSVRTPTGKINKDKKRTVFAIKVEKEGGGDREGENRAEGE